MVFDKVKKIIVDELEIDPEKVTLEANLAEDLEADSLDAVSLIMQLEEEFGLEIDDDAAQQVKTVGDLVKYIEDHQ